MLFRSLCPINQLTTIDVSTNTALIALGCQGNLITSLDLSLNTALTSLACHGNQLTSLNLKNGNNLNITGFAANANLLSCIQVDDVAYMNTNVRIVGVGAGFSYGAAGATHPADFCTSL